MRRLNSGHRVGWTSERPCFSHWVIVPKTDVILSPTMSDWHPSVQRERWFPDVAGGWLIGAFAFPLAPSLTAICDGLSCMEKPHGQSAPTS